MRLQPHLARRVALFAALILTACPSSLANPRDPVLEAVTDLRRVARLTGPNSLNQTDTKWDVAGTDLGHMFDMGDKLYMVFGDTFGRGFSPPPGSGSDTDWRSNVMAVIADNDPSDGLTFESMIVDTPGHAKELISPRRVLNEFTIIPTNGIAVGNRMYLHYMGVRQWGGPGQWTLTGAGLAYSDNGGQNWTRLPWSWPADTNFGQVAFVRHGDSIYLFGIPGGRKGGVKLARVLTSSITTQVAYQYYGGPAGWSSNPNAAVQIVPPGVGELSVMWNGYLNRWIMTYLSEPDIYIREAPDLTGPWSAPKVLVSARQYPGLYAPYMHPRLVERNGEIVYFTMSQWNPYDVSLMRVRLVKKPEPLTTADVVRALQIAGGLTTATSADRERLQAGAGKIDMRFTASLLRKVMGIQ